MKHHKGFLIDPEAKTIKQVEFNGDYRHIYELIGVDLFTVVQIDDNNTVFVDDEGLLKDPRYFFKLKGYPQPLAGKGLILGVDADGESVSSTYELEDVYELIPEFLELSVHGFETKEEDDVEIFPGVKGFKISNRPIFGPPKEEG